MGRNENVYKAEKLYNFEEIVGIRKDMPLIQDLISRWREQRAEKKRIEQMEKWEEGRAIKKISSNERNLMRFEEEDRQRRIKQRLQKHMKKLRDDVLYGRDRNPLYVKNVIRGQKNIFKNQPHIFTNAPDFLHQKRLFTR